jgi:hypothetical protein
MQSISLMLVVWAVLSLCPALSQRAEAATRLGLHVTQEELTIWRQRMTDNVNGVNGSSYQAIYQNRLLADANAFRSQSHPGGDGYWPGWTGAGCAPNNQSWAPGSGGTPFGRGNGSYLMRSAFTFLLTGNVSYATPVKTELVNLTTVPGLNWTNTSKFCYQNLQGGPNLEVMPWFYRMIVAYDYLTAGGYTGWTVSEKNAIETWLYNGAKLWDQAKVYGIQNNSHYPGIFNTPQDLTCVSCPFQSWGPLYYGGPTLDQATYYSFFNQFWYINAVSMAMGIIKNDQTLIDHAKAYVIATIKAGVYDNGAVGDYNRWNDCPGGCPGSMWDHSQGAIAPMIATADMLARTGDTSLYTLTAPTQILHGSGGTVGLYKVVKLFADLANKTVLLYGTTDPGQLNTSTLLSWDTEPSGSGGDYADFSSMVANVYYNDPAIHTAMTRNLLAGNTSGSCRDPQYGGCFSGGYINWADLPFMFGNMEGQVNPYALDTPTLHAPTNLRVLATSFP